MAEPRQALVQGVRAGGTKHQRHGAGEGLMGDGEMAFADDPGVAGLGEIAETKYLSEQVLHPALPGGGGVGEILTLALVVEAGPLGLGDTPVAADLVAKREPLGDRVVTGLLAGELQRIELVEQVGGQQPAFQAKERVLSGVPACHGDNSCIGAQPR